MKNNKPNETRRCIAESRIINIIEHYPNLLSRAKTDGAKRSLSSSRYLACLSACGREGLMSDSRRSRRPGNQRPSAQASIVFRQQRRPLVLRLPPADGGHNRAPAARRKQQRMPTAKICDFDARHRQRTPTANRIRRQKTRPTARWPLVKAATTARLCAHKTDSSAHLHGRRPAILADPDPSPALFTGLLTPGGCSSLIKRESSRSAA
uniref:Uncharacterized protein n=1 Tax=Plectus sambesii TaxID=2011161 RepID=A0A914ULQ1_9BILA